MNIKKLIEIAEEITTDEQLGVASEIKAPVETIGDYELYIGMIHKSSLFQVDNTPKIKEGFDFIIESETKMQTTEYFIWKCPACGFDNKTSKHSATSDQKIFCFNCLDPVQYFLEVRNIS